jgi:hypothetical protein
MSRKSSTIVAISGAAVLAAFVAFFVLRGGPPPSTTAPAAERPVAKRGPVDVELATHHTLPTQGRRASAGPPAVTRHDGILLDEAALMSTLRELRGSDPHLTLQLAREGNQRFEASADTAERSWFIVKALSDLSRHDEARAEGRALVENYRQTSWAEDVYRHLFVNPPTHPFERGYGKVLETDP